VTGQTWSLLVGMFGFLRALRITLTITHLVPSNWNTNDSELDPRLGPADGPRRNTWFNGATPDPYPNAGTVGDPSGLATGFTYPRDLAPLVISGFPADCWLVSALAPPPTFWQQFPDWQERQTQARAAQLIDLAYTSPSLAVDQALAWGALSASFIGDSSDWLPRTFYADFGTWQLVWIPGSTDAQLALQAFTAGLGPVRWGSMRTLLIHAQAADVTLARLTGLGYDPSRPLLLTGHSYGGAVAMLTAVRLQDADPNRAVRVITFGAPKIGDAATALHVSTVPSVHLVNRGDFVPDLPPSLAWVQPLFPIPPPFQGAWAEWSNPPIGRVILDADGTATYTQDSASTWADYRKAIQAVIDGDPVDVAPQHDIKVYLLRLTTP
jgi:hypothetical protein